MALATAMDKLNNVVNLAENTFEEAQKNSIKFVGMINEIVANKELAIDAELNESKRPSLLAKIFSGKQPNKETVAKEPRGKTSIMERMSDAQQLSKQLSANKERNRDSKIFSKGQERG